MRMGASAYQLLLALEGVAHRAAHRPLGVRCLPAEGKVTSQGEDARVPTEEKEHFVGHRRRL